MQYIYKVSISLDAYETARQNEFCMKITKISAEEKDKTVRFFDNRWRMLKKSNFNKLDTVYDENSFRFISYFVYTTEEKIEEAKQ
jgi:hypothetical protein